MTTTTRTLRSPTKRGYNGMYDDGEKGQEPAANVERKRAPGGYIWRERVDDAEHIILTLIAGEDDAAKRKKLVEVFEILRELQKYRGGTD